MRVLQLTEAKPTTRMAVRPHSPGPPPEASNQPTQSLRATLLTAETRHQGHMEDGARTQVQPSATAC